MSVIRWEEPPDRRHGPVHNWASIGRALRRRPGRWALIAMCDNVLLAGATAANIRKGTYRDLQPGSYEATSRTIDGEFRVYARYVGGDEPEVAP